MFQSSTLIRQMWLSLAPKDSGEKFFSCSSSAAIDQKLSEDNLWCIHQEKKENPEADEEDDAKREVEVKRGERGRGGRRSLVEMLEGI